MEKIIFLDIDGVLNDDDTTTITRIDGSIFVDEEKLLLLKQIVEATDAKIVLSSTWRYDREEPLFNGDFLELQEALQNIGLSFYSFTPQGAPKNRGIEIKNWLSNHPEVERFVILDDEWFDYWEEGLRPYMVKTYHREGLTKENAKQAIDILMSVPTLDERK